MKRFNLLVAFTVLIVVTSGCGQGKWRLRGAKCRPGMSMPTYAQPPAPPPGAPGAPGAPCNQGCPNPGTPARLPTARIWLSSPRRHAEQWIHAQWQGRLHGK